MSDSQISDALIERYRKVTVTTVYSGVRGQGYDPNFMKGVHARTPGANLVGRRKRFGSSRLVQTYSNAATFERLARERPWET